CVMRKTSGDLLAAIRGKDEPLVSVASRGVELDPNSADVRRRSESEPLVRDQSFSIHGTKADIAAGKRGLHGSWRQFERRIGAMAEHFAFVDYAILDMRKPPLGAVYDERLAHHPIYFQTEMPLQCARYPIHHRCKLRM